MWLQGKADLFLSIAMKIRILDKKESNLLSNLSNGEDQAAYIILVMLVGAGVSNLSASISELEGPQRP